AADLGEQVLALAHRTGEEPLEQLSHARLHAREPETPHTRPHDVESDNTGYQPVDVARTWHLHRILARGPRIGSPCRVFERIVDQQSCDTALLARRVEAIRRRTGRNNEKVDFAFTQRARFRARRNLPDGHARRVLERFVNPVRAVAGFDPDDRQPAAAAGKRNGERHRHQNREDECPEDGLRFARELAQPRERELDEWMPRSAAVDECRHSSRRCRPGSATNTSSSVPWWVTTRVAPSVAINSRGDPSAMTRP